MTERKKHSSLLWNGMKLITAVKRLIKLDNVMKLFFVVTDKEIKLARVAVPGMTLQPGPLSYKPVIQP